MNIKFYQTVDTIHGTIYYTKLEQQIINTPFFNRLHDVNQSSTVYLTFPPNRTKRFEHSMGTMQLTSDIFYNAAMNSSGTSAKELLMKKAKEAFGEVIAYIKAGKGKGLFDFHQKTLKTMDFLKSKSQEYFVEVIDKQFLTLFRGNCLLNYAPYDLNTGFNRFLFLCLLQSLRIVGLLHDIGHPPQSHVIEKILGEIDFELRERPEKELNERQKRFLNILSSYKDVNDESIVRIDEKMAIRTKTAEKEHLHEMIGIQIIKRIIDYVFPEVMEDAVNSPRSAEAAVQVLYYFTIIEFVFAVVRNKNAFWIGLHNIIDGTIDTDRLDFVPRDSRNSGMTWGEVPYKRLINTVRFGIVSKDGLEPGIYVCFSDKNIQQMDELLNSRYKIFSMINYHHRSTKIAALYQRAVKMLAEEYLESPEPDTEEMTYFSDISGLWRAIENVYSREASVLNLIQWNDSWLNGLLYRHMVKESVLESGNERLQHCCMYLREVFLGEHYHVSLIKRQTEMMEINEAVMENISNLLEKIEKELIAVQKQICDMEERIEENDKNGKKIYASTKSKLEAKQDAFSVLADAYAALNEFDWPEIETVLGKTIVTDAVKKVMESHKETVESYIIEKVKFSLGTGNAYVCDYDGKVEDYYKYSNIKDVLSEARLGFPFFYIYLKGRNAWELDGRFRSQLRKEIGIEIGNEICNSVDSWIDFAATRENSKKIDK